MWKKVEIEMKKQGLTKYQLAKLMVSQINFVLAREFHSKHCYSNVYRHSRFSLECRFLCLNAI